MAYPTSTHSTNQVYAGFTENCIVRNGIHHADADQAAMLTGCHHSGLVIPYHHYQNGRWEPVTDPGEKPYSRLRKDGVEGNGKYHQPADSRVHSYIPAELSSCTLGEVLILVEGEKKILSASDFTQGFSVPGIGLSGFYGYRLKKVDGEPHQLTAECDWAVSTYKTQAIAFLGDTDTALNWQFSHAAVEFRELAPDRSIILPRLPITGPKGIDDVRQELGPGFEKCFRRILDDAVELKAGMDADQLALALLERELPAVEAMGSVDKAKVAKKVVKMAAMMGGEAREQLLEIVRKPLGIGKTELRKIAAAEAKRHRQTTNADRLAEIRPKVQEYLYAGSHNYFRKVGDIFVPLAGEQSVQLALRNDLGLTGQNPGADPDDALGLYLIQKENAVAWAGPIAGHEAGLLGSGTSRIAVTEGPRFIEGSDGDAGPVVQFLADFLGREAGDPDWRRQLETLVGWLKQIRTAMKHPSDGLAGQALTLIGSTGTGKTSIVQQHLITASLGGRKADVSDFMAGRTKFNANLVGSEHLIWSDPEIPPDDKGRLTIWNQIKRVVANPFANALKKYGGEMEVEPIWRLSISLNPTRQALQILPPLDSSWTDKVIILKCYHAPSLPPADPARREAFRNELLTALPAFLAQVDRHPIPPELADPRFGIRAFHHPEVVHLMGSLDPAAKVTRFLDRHLTETRTDSATHTAREWHRILVWKYGTEFTEAAGDAREMGRLMAVLRDSSREQSILVEESGKEPYGNQDNYVTIWKVSKKPAP